MFNSQTLEIAIGLVFVFLVASLLCSTVRELIESILKTRAIQLERGIRLLLDDPDGTGTTKELFNHPQLFGLFEGVYDPARLTGFLLRTKTAVERQGTIVYDRAKRLPFGSTLPSYIPSRNFALALLDLAGAGGANDRSSSASTMEVLHANAMALRPGRLRDALLVALSEAEGDFDRARTSLEAWFDSCMDRVSGWYKRETQTILLVIGLIIAVGLNVDAISIASKLAQSNTLRQQVLLQAETTRHQLAVATPAGTPSDDVEVIKEAEAGLGDLIGWSNPRPDHRYLMPVGWIITALAVSLGAPFWFDMLNKLMVVRATVKPYEKSPPEGSDDRPGGPPPAERLEPQGSTAAVGVPAAPQASVPEAPINGFVRLSIDMAQWKTLILSVDGQQQPVPPDGNIELPLEMGTEHQLLVSAKDAKGKAVSWAQPVRLTYEDDLLPITATLA
ncbi:MAG TPA: hypothetical protein VE968_07775 [Sphingomicrobium sp.]|nr:hypothetical protein [Sphingomicrobium sp.]